MQRGLRNRSVNEQITPKVSDALKEAVPSHRSASIVPSAYRSPIKEVTNVPKLKEVAVAEKSFVSTGVQTRISTLGPAPALTAHDLTAARPTAAYWRSLVERFEKEIAEEEEKAFKLACELMTAHEEEREAQERLDILLEVLHESTVEDAAKEETKP